MRSATDDAKRHVAARPDCNGPGRFRASFATTRRARPAYSSSSKSAHTFWDKWKPKGLQRHMPVNIVITDWNDEEARATTDVVFIAQGEAGWSVQIVARYYDVFRQADGKWLLRRRADEYIGWAPPS